MAEKNKKKYYLFEMKGAPLNIISVILFLFFLILTEILIPSFEIGGDSLSISFLLLIFVFVFHEVLHSISYVICGADFKNITYGAHLEKGIFCCLCKQNISKKNILISLLTPFVVIGILTYFLGILFSNSVLIFLSILNISGCSGDLVMFFDLCRLSNFEYSEYDNPMAFGLYSGDDFSKKKLFGLRYLGSKDQLEKTVLKKVTITKSSVVILVIYFTFAILNIVM